MQVKIGETESTLFLVHAYDFGDNYHRMSDEPSSELEAAAKKIRRRYKNMGDYLEALAIYNKYMAFLRLRHGGAQMFKIKLKADQIDDFLPPKPRMKNNAYNKTLLKQKIVISRVVGKGFDHDVLDQTLAAMERRVLPSSELIVETDTKDKVADRIMKEENLRVDVKQVEQYTGIQFLEEYFRNKNAFPGGGVPDKKSNKDQYRPQYSLKDIISGKALDDPSDTTEDDEVIYYRGQYMHRQTVEELKVYQKLGEAGWNHVKIMKDKKVNKKITKIVKNQNKENKKKKKKNKEDDDFLVKMVMDGGYDSYGDFEKEMLNFTSEQVFGRKM